MKKPTDEDLSHLADKHSPCCDDANCACQLVGQTIAELRQLREALLSAVDELERIRPVYEAAVGAAADRYTARRELAWDALNMAVRAAIDSARAKTEQP